MSDCSSFSNADDEFSLLSLVLSSLTRSFVEAAAAPFQEDFRTLLKKRLKFQLVDDVCRLEYLSGGKVE